MREQITHYIIYIYTYIHIHKYTYKVCIVVNTVLQILCNVLNCKTQRRVKHRQHRYTFTDCFKHSDDFLIK